jgi:hypothetical protein
MPLLPGQLSVVVEILLRSMQKLRKVLAFTSQMKVDARAYPKDVARV